MTRSSLVFGADSRVLVWSMAAQLGMATLGLNADASEASTSPANREVYIAYGCYQCHGYEGQGGGSYGGPRIAPPVWPFEAFAAQLRRPRGSPIPMPAYSPSILNEADLKRIYDYLVLIPQPIAPAM
jgi:mono/diheme cytochrome c family protein